MNISFFYLFFAFLLQADLAICKNILAVFPHFGKSHYFMYEPYIIKLAERGHNVTLITWFEIKNLDKSIETIHFGDENVPHQMNLAEYETRTKFLMSFNELQILNEMGQECCIKAFSHPKIKDLINSKKRFDLVVVEYFNTDCFAVFGHLFKAPLIGIFSSAPMPWHNERMGNPDNPSYIVNMFSGFPSEMDFFTRVKNFVSVNFCKYYYKFFYNGPTDKIIRRHVGKGIPKIDDIVRNTSVFLINSHFSVFQPRPFVPGMVEVSGLHLKETKKLPADLEKFISNSKNGVIYFSLGSVTRGSSLPAKKRDAIARAFGNISMDVIWKWEDDDLPGKPKNVVIKKWVPQSDILAHPNVKLFITHGGLMGTLEAVSQGVPMIFIPLFGDQFLNAASVAEKGAGVVLDYFSINERKFLRTVTSVLEDKRYAENAKLLAARFKERPLSPINSAVYWTEYVLKFKGASHLKPAVMKLWWFSEYLIDVALFVFICLFLVVYLGKKGISNYKAMKQAQIQAEKNKKK